MTKLYLKKTDIEEVQKSYDKWREKALKSEDTHDFLDTLLYGIFILNNHIVALEERIKELEKSK